MEEGFRRMQDGAEDVAVTVKKLGSVLENAYAAAGDSKAVTKACDKLQELKNAYAAVSDQLNSEKRKLATLKEDYAWLSEQLNPYGDTSKTGFNLDLDTFLEYQEALKALPDQIEKQTALVEQLEKKWTKSSEAVNNAVTKVTATVNAELEKQNAAMKKAAADQATAVEQSAARQQESVRETTNVVMQESAEQSNATASAAASVESQGTRRVQIYDSIAIARNNLASQVTAAAQREAAAEERASQRVIAAEEKEAAAKERSSQRTIAAEQREAAQRNQITQQLMKAGSAASLFGTKLRGIAASAFVFNVISAGIRKVTDYFGKALMANDEFAAAVNGLKTSLAIAFQPIYEAVLPALIKLINWLNIAVQAIGRFFAMLAGKSYDEMKRNATALNSSIQDIGDTSTDTGGSIDDLGDSTENLGDTAGNTGDIVGDTGDAIEDTGEQAKKAEKYLAGFDEINRMLAKDLDDVGDNLGDINFDDIPNPDIGTGSGNGSGSGSGSNVVNPGTATGPVFEEIEFPESWETMVEKLAMRIKDIFFEWENLNAEIVAEKLLTALTALAGGLIGFSLGGVKGALIGMLIGAALGVVLSSIIFDGDGKLSAEELIQSLMVILGIIGGGLIGFKLAGAKGALIGVLIGAALTLGLSSAIFDKDGTLSKQEILKSLLSVLGVVAGGLIGFKLGGLGGAAIGAVIGLGLSFALSKIDFSQPENAITTEQLLDALVVILGFIGGAAIGFAVGGPAGATLGAAIGLGLTLALSKLDFSQSENAITTEQLLSTLLPVLGLIGGAAVGFTLGGPGGAAIGAAIGLGISFKVLGSEFKEVEKEYNSLNKIVSKWSKNATATTENDFIHPVSAGITGLIASMKSGLQSWRDTVAARMTEAEKITRDSYIDPTTTNIELLGEFILQSMDHIADKIIESWVRTGDETETGYINRTREQFEGLIGHIKEEFYSGVEEIKSIFRDLPKWFQENITDPIVDYFNDLIGGLVNGFNKTAQTVSNAIDNLMDSFSNIISNVSRRVANFSASSSARTSSNAVAADAANVSIYQTYPTMDIPMLARGAVIPPNHKFLAVLGDQKSGTNVEAPLATIQEAVALVMEDMIQSNIAGHEATVEVLRQILEAVLGIELDGETLSRAINRHNRKMAMVRGV
jgi:hypothetical protein